VASTTRASIAREFYDAFQRVELDRWDAIVDENVFVNGPAGRGISGLRTLKDWAGAFATLGKQIDLTDEHVALDEDGNGRGFVVINLHWKHDHDFMGLAPTGREGTSVEFLVFAIENERITKIDVADHSVDLPIYLWQRNVPLPHHVLPDAIVVGVDRRE
jgi:SnoaL-like polyketide cyclase